jgi:hypothetical protein
MAWIIASIPFWLLFIGSFGLSFAGLCSAIADTEQSDWNNLVLGTFALMALSGVFAFIAAKMCS